MKDKLCIDMVVSILTENGIWHVTLYKYAYNDYMKLIENRKIKTLCGIRVTDCIKEYKRPNCPHCLELLKRYGNAYRKLGR